MERFIAAVNALLRERLKVLIGLFLVALLFPMWKTVPVGQGLYREREIAFIFMPPELGEIDPLYYLMAAAFLTGAYYLIPARLSDSAEKEARTLISACAAFMNPPPPVRSQGVEKKPVPPPLPKREPKRLHTPPTTPKGIVPRGMASLQRNAAAKAGVTIILGIVWGGVAGALGYSLPNALNEFGYAVAGPLGAWFLGVVFLSANYLLAHFAVEMASAHEARVRLTALTWGCVVFAVLVAALGGAFFLVGGYSDDGGPQYGEMLAYDPFAGEDSADTDPTPTYTEGAARGGHWEPVDYDPFANQREGNTEDGAEQETLTGESTQPTTDWALELAASDTRAFVDGGTEYVAKVRRKWETVLAWYGQSNTEKGIAEAVATIMTARERYPGLTRAHALDYLNAVARESKTFDASADAHQAVRRLNSGPVNAMQSPPRAEDLVVPVGRTNEVQQRIPDAPPKRPRPRTVVNSYPGTGGGHWVGENIDSGEFILLEDDSLWEIDRFDKIDATLWLRLDNITVVESSDGSLGFDYLLINTDDGESAHAKYLGRK